MSGGPGTLTWVTALDAGELLAPPVLAALRQWAQRDAAAARSVLAAPIDATLADTAAFCAAYGVAMEESVNCVVVAGRRGEVTGYAACMVQATRRADVNGVVRKAIDARKASFAPMGDAVSLTGMEYGGITPLGVPDGWPVLVDSDAQALDGLVVIGSGLRRSKIALPAALLADLPGATTPGPRAAPLATGWIHPLKSTGSADDSALPSQAKPRPLADRADERALNAAALAQEQLQPLGLRTVSVGQEAAHQRRENRRNSCRVRPALSGPEPLTQCEDAPAGHRTEKRANGTTADGWAGRCGGSSRVGSYPGPSPVSPHQAIPANQLGDPCPTEQPPISPDVPQKPPLTRGNIRQSECAKWRTAEVSQTAARIGSCFATYTELRVVDADGGGDPVNGRLTSIHRASRLVSAARWCRTRAVVLARLRQSGNAGGRLAARTADGAMCPGHTLQK